MSKEETKSALETLETAPKEAPKQPKRYLQDEVDQLRKERDEAIAKLKAAEAQITIPPTQGFGGTSVAAEKEDPKAKMAEKQAREREEFMTPVTGWFRNLEAPGDKVEFMFKKFKGQTVEKYTLKDGEECTIPLGIARHINEKGKIPEYKPTVGIDGRPQRIKTTRQRFVFSSTEFIVQPEITLPTVSF